MIRPPPKIDSPITVLPFEEFNKMSTNEVQQLFSHSIIVVKDHPHHLEFNLDGLEQLGDLDELRIMHGMCLFSGSPRSSFEPCIDLSRDARSDPNNVHVLASLRQLYETTKIVNALELRQQGTHLAPHQLATDMVALRMLHESPPPHFPASLYPLHEMTFGLAATESAYHKEHFDRSGFTTDILVHCGQKWWLIGVPMNGSSSCACAADFGYELFESRNVYRGYKWYGLLLLPGMRL